MVAESWFRGLWKTSKNHDHGREKVRIGVLAFEVASLLSKLVHQWSSLTDKQVMKLKDEISNSAGIRKLVSDDDGYIVDLICAEMLHNLENVARVVIRLAKRCNDPALRSFENAYDDLIKSGVDPHQWQLSPKKMSKKVKKMEKFVLINANLYQEIETVTELEQIVRRMKNNEYQDSITVVEYTKKLSWRKQEVKRLKEMSLWNKSHDYVVFLLARSVFTIFYRIAHVFGMNHVLPGVDYSDSLDSDHMNRSQSVSALLQSSIHPSEYKIARFSSGPLGDIISRSGPISNTNNMNAFYSGPIGNSIPHSGPSGKQRNVTFSGPIGNSTPKSASKSTSKSITKSGPLARVTKTGLKLWHGKTATPNRLSTTGPFTGHMIDGNGSAFPHRIEESDVEVSSKQKKFDAPPETLGAAALALHYANVIIVLEKLVASPHLIGHDARDDLYNMLPQNVRCALRTRLKPYAKSLASSDYDTGLAEEWSEAISGTLEWLSPLAHSMIRWQSERSFEHQNLLSKTNVLLVQTLHYANQEKTEATITELLVGLNYIWRFGREVNAKAMLECESGGVVADSNEPVNSVS